MASADDFFPLRRFAAVNTRVILMMQDEIVRLEERLEQLDRDLRNSPADVHNGCFRSDVGTERESILYSLQKHCHRYSALRFALLSGILQNHGTMRMQHAYGVGAAY